MHQSKQTNRNKQKQTYFQMDNYTKKVYVPESMKYIKEFVEQYESECAIIKAMEQFLAKSDEKK